MRTITFKINKLQDRFVLMGMIRLGNRSKMLRSFFYLIVWVFCTVTVFSMNKAACAIILPVLPEWFVKIVYYLGMRVR